MKLFVAGATGVLGRPAVRALIAAGHEVRGIARAEEKAAMLRGYGAEPVTVDLFDPGALKDAAAGSDVVINLATHIPPLSKAALPGAWNENSRIRTEGSRNLVDAALSAGASRYIQEAICFMYKDHGAGWIDENAPMAVPKFALSLLDAEREAKRFADGGGAGVVLRFAQFYAPGAVHTTSMIKLAKARIAPALGDPDGYMPMIHIDDAASAVVAALDAPSGAYNVVEDNPLSKRGLAQAVAHALDTKPPHHLPKVVGKAAGSKTDYMLRSQRVSNRRFKDATGWSPRYPDGHTGWPAVVSAAEAS
jgi:nucleoside-diphosphate-sugar epimerase